MIKTFNFMAKASSKTKTARNAGKGADDSLLQEYFWIP
jgi:hypothetical protein